ncbi:peptidylprolyl isomerase [Actibacterium lipolyticum]|uniref:Parvulin-like PPIase n=1 Tax=Actibacterium lipolyticum TaxID=1524263 RepID=A0A238JVH0_9RHOB|nr:peptidylprolyl isomerase [Actibacterium lipolyticum]SMX34503.1 Chaperone SurA precursor [Actibacterium lipolyticum]
MTRLTRLLSALCVGLVSFSGPAAAQNSGAFAPRVIVNDRAVTNYEVQQRILFMKLLNSPGSTEDAALDGLIEDRLRLDAAKDIGVQPPEEQILAGMSEFAGRANLSLEEFTAAIGNAGVAQETFRDFVHAGIAWREVVRARFGPRAQISEAEIDRALALSSRQGSARVLLSEIILRADTPAFEAQSKALAERLSRQIKTPQAFAAAARQYSLSGSRGQGGRIEWLDLGNLPPSIASQVLSLGPGEVTDPISVPNAIALFQLRAIEETDAPAPETLSIEYAQFFLTAGDTAEAENVRNQVDTCDDLYGVALGLPDDRLVRQALALTELPQDLALELAKLDEGESVTVDRGNVLSVLMLCGRTAELGEDVDREAIRQRLFNQRLTSYADSYLAELKADAIIRNP